MKYFKLIQNKLNSVNPNNISYSLKNGWRNPNIPKSQRKLTEKELSEMYRGNIIPAWSILAEILNDLNYNEQTLLEVGCATGYHKEVLNYLLGRKVNYYGLDYSNSMIKMAKQYYPKTYFMIGDATSLPFPNNSFDILISGCVILHVQDYKKVIIESVRVSRKWIILHKTPIINGKTKYFKKKAYGVPCFEIHFNEKEILNILSNEGLFLRNKLVIKERPYFQITYLYEKKI